MKKKRYVIGMFIGSVLSFVRVPRTRHWDRMLLSNGITCCLRENPQADGRIVDLYEKYGSYFLYDFYPVGFELESGG